MVHPQGKLLVSERAGEDADRIQAMESSFQDGGRGSDVPVAHAAGVIVLAAFGGLFPPFTLYMVNSTRLGPEPGNTCLLLIWLVLVIIVFLFLKRSLRVAVPAPSEDAGEAVGGGSNAGTNGGLDGETDEELGPVVAQDV